MKSEPRYFIHLGGAKTVVVVDGSPPEKRLVHKEVAPLLNDAAADTTLTGRAPTLHPYTRRDISVGHSLPLFFYAQSSMTDIEAIAALLTPPAYLPGYDEETLLLKIDSLHNDMRNLLDQYRQLRTELARLKKEQP